MYIDSTHDIRLKSFTFVELSLHTMEKNAVYFEQHLMLSNEQVLKVVSLQCQTNYHVGNKRILFAILLLRLVWDLLDTYSINVVCVHTGSSITLNKYSFKSFYMAFTIST